MLKRVAMLIVLGAFVAMPALARQAPCEKKCAKCIDPPSITLLAGLGSDEDRFGDGDVTALSAALDYPVSTSLSLLGRYDHRETDWDATPAWSAIGADSKSNVFSFGVRFWLR